jgi:hypothetical protein
MRILLYFITAFICLAFLGFAQDLINDIKIYTAIIVIFSSLTILNAIITELVKIIIDNSNNHEV